MKRLRSMGYLVWMRGLFIALFGWWWLGGTGVLADADVQAPAASLVVSTQTVFLKYRELNFPVVSWPVSADIQNARFRKEPESGHHQVIRGKLGFGNSPEQSIPFALDRSARKLFLDLNRNQDLTDDPNGVFTCSFNNPRAGKYQTATNVHLAFETPKGSHPALMDLSFFFSGAELTVFATCRYCWEGKISVGDRDWQLALVDNLAGKIGDVGGSSLIVRPWNERDEPCSGRREALESIDFCKNLFFGGELFSLESAYVQQDKAPAYRLELKRQAAECGEIRLPGKFIHRVVFTRDVSSQSSLTTAAQEAFAARYGLKLTSGGEASAGKRLTKKEQAPLTVVLESPGPVERIPIGEYHYRLTLKAGNGEAYRPADVSGLRTMLGSPVIIGSNAVVLNVGGPLTNMVSVSKNGDWLLLNYSLVGLGGDRYQMLPAGPAPEFTIYRGDKQVSTGQFEYG